MRVHFASIKMDLAYNQEKSIKIRRFPTNFETAQLKKPKYKLVDEEAFTSDNQLEIRLYYNPRRKSIKVFSGGNYDFNEGGRYGIDIDIKMKHAEKDLIDYLCGITRDLCKEHFKPAIIFPSRHSVNCQIDECKLIHSRVKLFLEDFVNLLESEIAEFRVTKKKKEIEEKADERVAEIEERLEEFVCGDCGNTFNISKRDSWFDKDSGKFHYICSDCYSKRKQLERSLLESASKKADVKDEDVKSNKMSTKWKITLGTLTVIAILSIILLLNSLGIF